MISSDCVPALTEFRRLSRRHNLIPIYREALADLETPVSAYLKVANKPHSFLLESVEGGEKMARFSFIGVSPSIIFKSKGRDIMVQDGAGTRSFRTARSPLDELEKIMRSFRQAPAAGLPPFSGGAVGFMGYDTVRFFEKLPDKNPDRHGIPDSLFLFTDTLLAFDHIQKNIKVVCNVRVKNTAVAAAAYRLAEKKIDGILRQLQRPAPAQKVLSAARSARPVAMRSNFKKNEFCGAVLKAKRYIKAGDIFQVVFSQAFRTKIHSRAFDIYRSLRSINPSPYMFYLNGGAFQLVGSSPEVHVRYEDGKALLRPIAGTRPRGKDEREDLKFERQLLADAKERAEHLMLVDLGRNDLGRVCEFKSVRVPEFMTIERYSHVMHIVSLVEGALKKKSSVFDLLKATFPAGTVSGAPKVRAMEIIDELENQKRGFYSGIVGYFSYSGNLDSCIAIRTILVQNGVATVQAGAGIVADSVPEKEYQETVNKAKALVKAIEIAERGKTP